MITIFDHHGIIYRSGIKKPALSYRERMELARSRNLSGTWRLTGISEMDEAMIVDPRGKKLLRQQVTDNHELLISFFEDSTFTQIRTNGEYDQGRWAVDTSTSSLFLTSGRSTLEIAMDFDVTREGSRMLVLDFSPGNSVSLVEYARRTGGFREDPFHPSNNTWRIRPQRPENRSQLVYRLTNYIRHNAYLLNNAALRKDQTVSWEFSEGIIKLFNVGVGVVKEDKMPQSWINCFYSRENALEARAIFEDYLLKAKHPGHNTGNWVRDDCSILTDIHNGLRKW
ncbi:hypothetical protein [Dyadobacter sandarakinus]|uniref:Uncharacterized protein n=1 Tax=Dyadobacter sandarakinus TaxID=2747268 RepID=A0ABX7I298_9BACT|nr:hypothetical protein [Dyadobacter sandarakinus]QRQ99661.1 hypothetical protein HWI92_01390 [Dyadobacter sandarakinus]